VKRGRKRIVQTQLVIISEGEEARVGETEERSKKKGLTTEINSPVRRRRECRHSIVKEQSASSCAPELRETKRKHQRNCKKKLHNNGKNQIGKKGIIIRGGGLNLSRVDNRAARGGS